MIIVETVEVRGGTFTHTYSDANRMIRKVGTDELYSEAYDVLDYSYEETEIEIPPDNGGESEA